jgi:hypothetical protein
VASVSGSIIVSLRFAIGLKNVLAGIMDVRT